MNLQTSRTASLRQLAPGYLKDFSLAFFPFALMLGALLWFYQEQQHRAVVIGAEGHELVRVAAAKKLIGRDFASVLSDLMILANGEELKRFLLTTAEPARQALNNQFALFSKEKKIYDQIRFIDQRGMERVRVDHGSPMPVITPMERLQDKSSRYYFTKTLQLRRGAVFVSPFDLNVEHGEVERPLKPMIRVATPVFDVAGERRGVLILNYLGAVLLENLKQALDGAWGEGMLLNADGYWLYAPDPEDEWGFMFDHGAGFAERYPRAWERIGATGEGQFYHQGDLYTFTTVSPLLDASMRGLIANLEGSVETSRSGARGYRWKILTRLPRVGFEALFERQRSDYRGFFVLTLLIIAVLALSYAHVRAGHRRSEESLRLAARAMEVTRDGVVIRDAKRQVISVNHAFSALTGYNMAEIVGTRGGQLHGGEYDQQASGAVWESVAGGGQWEGEVAYRRKSGERFPARTTLSAVCDANGRVRNFVEIFSDISERKLYEQHLEAMAHHDALTGLPNRNLLGDRLEMAIAGAHRHGDKLALLFVDLNRFKPINDQYGHEVGDAVLKQVALTLRSCVRENDTVARIGGDEFVVLLQEFRERENARRVIDQVHEALAVEMRVNGLTLSVGASIGLAIYPDDAEDPEILMKKADMEMYRVKRGGAPR